MAKSLKEPLEGAPDDQKFQRVVQHFLKTPPKPHKEMKRKSGETVEQDKEPWDQSDPNCPSA